jgi:ubiquinone/menaquinone biosynthesis C-methylase UbiE
MNRILNILKPIPYLEFFRNSAIVEEIKKYLKNKEKVLDVGCGNGKLSYQIKVARKLRITGIDSFYKTKLIPFKKADAERMPFKNKQFDVSIFIDVLHHSRNIKKVLKEAKRVSKRIIIKDHYYETGFQKVRLKTVDFLFNFIVGYDIPLNFLTIREWKENFKSLGLNVIKMNKNFKINRFDIIKHVFFVVE